MYNKILFDLDGTLTDPAVGITNSVAYALEKFGITVEDKMELCKFIGPPLLDAFSEYYGFSREESLKALEYYREYFRSVGIFENKLYPGTAELLASLKSSGKRIILATSKPEKFAKIILEHFKIDSYFDFVAGASMDETRSKKSDVIAYALEECSIRDLDDVVMVGDREHDVLGAGVFGIDSIGVLYGYGCREELSAAGATYIVNELKEILDIV